MIAKNARHRQITVIANTLKCTTKTLAKFLNDYPVSDPSNYYLALRMIFKYPLPRNQLIMNVTSDKFVEIPKTEP